jgi:hypothetical protein
MNSAIAPGALVAKNCSRICVPSPVPIYDPTTRASVIETWSKSIRAHPGGAPDGTGTRTAYLLSPSVLPLLALLLDSIRRGVPNEPTFTDAAHTAAATAIATILRINPNKLLSDGHLLTAFQLRLPTTTGGI